MLVLSRKTGERIQIGDGIELEVLAVNKSRIKLGITCPREIRIIRAELVDAVADGAEGNGRLNRIHAAVG